MPKGYWIARVDIHDPNAYRAYVAANGAVFRKYGARFLVRGGQSLTPEGTVRERNVVLEFPSYADAVGLLRIRRLSAGEGSAYCRVRGGHRDHRRV